MAISIIQIVLAVVIITLILLQERSSGISGLLGGDGSEKGLTYQVFRHPLTHGIAKEMFYNRQRKQARLD